ncbi:snake venom serine protease ussurase-like isoform X2 [Convolutriloba macropyga]|uniref:snake venom serine protease ussurase-like isoform X2 n=1 Tax=Convolutriloba macropyga TaxID=536237 RepID=UPI003F5246CC
MMLNIFISIIFSTLTRNTAPTFTDFKPENSLSRSFVSLIINGNVVTSHIPYFARIRTDDVEDEFCGGVVVHKNWVITVARCVNHVRGDIAALQNILVEVGHFEHSTNIPAGVGRYRLLDIIAPSSPDLRVNVDTIALLRLARSMPLFRVASLCMAPVPSGSLLRAAGLGSTSQYILSPSLTLMEMEFTESKFSYSPTAYPHVFACPPNQICVSAVTLGSSICYMDEVYGNSIFCNDEIVNSPMCVLGIASHSQPSSINPNVPCGTSYFTSVFFYSNWIQTVISHDNYPNP